MSGSVNKVILIGNVGRDPELRTMQNGTMVANLSLATSETWKDKSSGERKEKTEWHRVVVFGDLCKVVEAYVQKGSKLYVEGQLQTRKWTDAKGAEKYSTEVVLQGFGGRLTLLGGKPSRDDTPVADNARATSRDSGPGRMDDEIPFMRQWQ